MREWTIKPIFAWDCNSFDGTNEVEYIKEIKVIAPTKSEALELIIARFIEQKLIPPKNQHVRLFDKSNKVAWILNYCDRKGNNLTKEDFQRAVLEDLDEIGYNYQFIEFRIS